MLTVYLLSTVLYQLRAILLDEYLKLSSDAYGFRFRDYQILKLGSLQLRQKGELWIQISGLQIGPMGNDFTYAPDVWWRNADKMKRC